MFRRCGFSARQKLYDFELIFKQAGYQDQTIIAGHDFCASFAALSTRAMQITKSDSPDSVEFLVVFPQEIVPLEHQLKGIPFFNDADKQISSVPPLKNMTNKIPAQRYPYLVTKISLSDCAKNISIGKGPRFFNYGSNSLDYPFLTAAECASLYHCLFKNDPPQKKFCFPGSSLESRVLVLDLTKKNMPHFHLIDAKFISSERFSILCCGGRTPMEFMEQ